MRTLLVGSGLSLVFAVTAGAQARDSSYWTLGVSRGFVSTSRYALENNSSAGALQVEWRRLGSRVAVRTELGVAQRHQLFGPAQLCSGCYNEYRSGSTTLLASVVYELRQGRMLRPYALLGAGLYRGEWTSTSSLFAGTGPDASSSATTLSRTNMGALVAGGLGISAHVGRFSAFAEGRLKTQPLSPNEIFNVGIRIRPD